MELMTLTPPDFIDLDRRFARSLDADSEDYWHDYFAERDTPRDWSWLRTRSPVVALLAQAGSGKTFEFQNQVDRTRRTGADAFFFRVERLCSAVLDETHETPECRNRFEAWLASDGSAEFFLDAVDEAKLPQTRTSRPLGDALAKLAHRLGPHLGRITIFVSCRSSEWFDQVEQASLQTFANDVARASGSEPFAVFNATFQPLDLKRIRKLADDRGGEDAISVLTDSEAIPDIVTPLDAVLYLETYQQFSGTADLAARFASRGKLIETSLRRRLAEEGGTNKRSQLDFGSALRAARYLAFASVVAQTLDISIGSPRRDCLDPDTLLAAGHAGLSSGGIRQLLACSLFVPAGQARVRFYRREARDMLAAQWLRDRIEEGASSQKVADRFIKEAFGKPIVPIGYGSMLAWLASYDPPTRRRMIEAAPEWVIEDGDPRSLALEDRIAALEQHLRLGPHRFHGEFMFEVGELRRFARPELELAILSHFSAPLPGDLFKDLMQFTQAGRYRSAAPALVVIVKDFSRSSGERMFAMRALADCGDTEHFRDVAEHFAATGGPTIVVDELFARPRNDRFLLDLIMAAYPRAISAPTALTLCRQFQGKDYSSEAKTLSRWLMETIPAADLQQWYVGLDALCFDTSQEGFVPFGRAAPGLPRRATILLRSLVEITARYIGEVQSSDLDRDVLIYDRVRHALHLGAGYSMSRGASPISPALTANRSLRRDLYEKLAGANERRRTIHAYLRHLNAATYENGADDEDLIWFLDRYRKSEGAERADLAQSAVIVTESYRGLRKCGARWRIARTALVGGPWDWSLLREVTITPLIAPLRHYRARREWRRYDPDGSLVGRPKEGLEKARRTLRIWWRRGELRQGTDLGLMGDLIFSERFEVPDEAGLITRFGPRLGPRLTEGIKAHARRYTPIDHWPTIYGADTLAIGGYQFIWNADHAMPGVECTSAIKAAFLFADDWPEWATRLVRDNPKAWTKLVVPALAKEIASARGQEIGTYSRFLAKISPLDEALQLPLSAPLFEAVAGLRVIDGIDLNRLIKILAADPAIEKRIPGFAARHAREAWHEGAFRRALSWLPFWAEHDPAGLATLLSWIESEPALVERGLQIYVRLSGQNSAMPRPPLDIRYRFAKLAFAHIAPADDPPPQEGVHSVTARDELQRLRGDVGEMLSAEFDAAERAALDDLLATYVTPVSPGWANRWRDRHTKLAVKPAAWSHAAIVEAADDLTGAPSSGDELFARISEMIADLEDELARGEFDRRGLFTPTIREADFRAWLGHALDNRRRPWFSIVQEAETSSAKRTDLRIELRATGNAVVVIEIKLLHRWTYEDLIDKFQSQLVGQYLLTDRVRHGIYLVVDLGKRAKGAMPDGSMPGADEVVALLNEVASPLALASGKVARAQLFKAARPAA